MSARSSRPPPSSREAPKRPWFLMLALIAAWVFGASGFVDGCSTWHFYQSDVLEPADFANGIRDDAARAAVLEAAQRYVGAMSDARAREFPLGVAALLLGAVTVAFAARAMGGREGARRGLIQLVIVQTALVVATHVLTPDVRRARAARDVALTIAQAKDTGQDARTVDQMERLYPRLFAAAPTVAVVLRVLAAGLVLLALTRARSRAFFAATEARWTGSEP